MISFIKGDIFESNAQAIVNTVNTDGIMGKGIALQFKKRYPNNYKLYQQACKNKTIDIGKLFVTKEGTIVDQERFIINFPTKTTWKKPSEYSYIEKGLDDLVKIIKEHKIKSIAIPPLGAGNGGLNWETVKNIIEEKLKDIECDIYVFQPNALIQEVLNTERVKLTNARAMLLSVFYELVRQGEFISEFSSEKIAYFLQRFGAETEFKLKFEPKQYGPYSGKVRHVLYYLNGSYITGYGNKDKKPFEEMGLIMSTEKDVENYLQQPANKLWLDITKKVKRFLNGFYSDFGLELLSSVDFVITNSKATETQDILNHIISWNERKKELFSNPRFIEKAKQRIDEFDIMK